ncbi:unnamed protein product [Owenia fusiformis]|uniref:Alpha N-terminal protein methyltransferase 1 n=1 Tax=Owenia fusiformis TaxID=6347 RepID=A0A8J1U0Y3_OWEFU|nr:unnamed protein product [Owenia fusiformis]
MADVCDQIENSLKVESSSDISSNSSEVNTQNDNKNNDQRQELEEDKASSNGSFNSKSDCSHDEPSLNPAPGQEKILNETIGAKKEDNDILPQNGNSNNPLYEDAKSYWQTVPPTVDGMLGGFARISTTDIAGSNKFLRSFIKGPKAKTKTRCVVDCGCGIGRITKRLLLQYFDKVDMVEQDTKFITEARTFLGDGAKKVDNFFNCGLQDFEPVAERYDVIWCQWVLGHLSDDDFVQFFRRCREGLAEDGVIIIKENVTGCHSPEFDKQDSSFTRPKSALVELINKSGCTIIKQEKQKNFPKSIFDVWMFALM